MTVLFVVKVVVWHHRFVNTLCGIFHFQSSTLRLDVVCLCYTYDSSMNLYFDIFFLIHDYLERS